MKKNKKLLWYVACIICFSVGFILSRMFFVQRVVTYASGQYTSNISFSIPNVPLPTDWGSKTNLPGNSFETAFTLNPGIKTQGTLNSGNVIDFYTFNIKNPSQIVIDVTDVPHALFWVLYDNQKKEIASTYRKGSLGGSTQISLNNPGNYYIKVWADYQEVENYPYTIRLAILPYFE